MANQIKGAKSAELEYWLLLEEMKECYDSFKEKIKELEERIKILEVVK